MPQVSVSLTPQHIDAVKRHQARIGLTGERDFSKALQLIIVNFDRAQAPAVSTVSPAPAAPAIAPITDIEVEFDQRPEVERLARPRKPVKVAA